MSAIQVFMLADLLSVRIRFQIGFPYLRLTTKRPGKNFVARNTKDVSLRRPAS